MEKLEKSEIQKLYDQLDSTWTLNDDKISNDFQFRNFEDAFSFMKTVADEIEKVNHHPNWENVYNKVKIVLWTHEVSGLSQKDFDLASRIDTIYNNFAAK